MYSGFLITTVPWVLLEGKMLAVVAVLIAIFLGIVGLLLWLESRVRKLEKKSSYVED